jgi:hypothetical protein
MLTSLLNIVNRDKSPRGTRTQLKSRSVLARATTLFDRRVTGPPRQTMATQRIDLRPAPVVRDRRSDLFEFD